MNAKVYVPVITRFDDEGNMRPMNITWEDGRTYSIDRVLDIRPAAAMKAGGQGDRYTIVVNGKQSYLFFEHSPKITGCQFGRWFVERRVV